MWYQDWFKDTNYLVVYEHRDNEEAMMLMDLIERTIGSNPARRALDLGCGSGRHAIALAKRGYKDIVGVDLSPTLLAQARQLAARDGAQIEFIERDMRNLEGLGVFDLVINLFTSFGYFESDEENESVVQAVSSVLRSGSYFVLDFLNASWLRRHLVAHDERFLPTGERLEQTRWIEHGRVEKRILLRQNEEAHEYVESVRLFELEDFERMFAAHGLLLDGVFGSYEGASYDKTHSQRLIMFARRA